MYIYIYIYFSLFTYIYIYIHIHIHMLYAYGHTYPCLCMRTQLHYNLAGLGLRVPEFKNEYSPNLVLIFQALILQPKPLDSSWYMGVPNDQGG